MPAQHVAREGVDPDLRLVADRHVGELGLLEIRHHPHPRQRRQRGDLAADRGVLAWTHLPGAQDAILGGHDAGVAEVDLGGAQIGLLGLDGGFRLGLLGLQHPDLPLGGLHLGLVLSQLGEELFVRGGELFAGLHG